MHKEEAAQCVKKENISLGLLISFLRHMVKITWTLQQIMAEYINVTFFNTLHLHHAY